MSQQGITGEGEVSAVSAEGNLGKSRTFQTEIMVAIELLRHSHAPTPNPSIL